MPKKRGALPDFMIRELIENDVLQGAHTEDVSPSSVDLRVTDMIWRVRGFFLPRPGETIAELLRNGSIGAERHDPNALLEAGVTYVAMLELQTDLPREYYGYANPKSSSGRDNLQVRMIADKVTRFDSLPRGHKGDVAVVITPGSFPVRNIVGEKVLQVRFFTEDTRFDPLELAMSFDSERLLWGSNGKQILLNDITTTDEDGSVLFTVSVPDSEIVGWECLGSSHVLDLALRDQDSRPFFRPLYSTDGAIFLRKGGFYLLYMKEYVRVPPRFALELAPTDHRAGEFRAHFAGFIDPGWGFGIEGEGKGRPLVLEVIPHENVLLRDGQPITKGQFELMYEEPEDPYDTLGTSNYVEIGETPPFSKRFKKA